MALAELDDEALIEAVRVNGSRDGAARALGIARTTFGDEMRRRGLIPQSATAPRRGPRPKITRETLTQALIPPNGCKVKKFAETLDEDSREVLNEALGYSREDMSARAVMEWLVGIGFSPDDVPGVDAINAHRAGTKPCRCKG